MKVGTELPWKSVGSWKWFDGKEHWWEVSVIFRGINGAGGAVIEERWRWNGSSQIIRKQSRSLTPEETQKVCAEIAAKQKERTTLV